MAKFAKLIELDNEQVLLTIDYNTEEDKYEVKVRTDLEGVITQITAGYKTEEEAINMLDNYTEKNAIFFREQMERICS